MRVYMAISTDEMRFFCVLVYGAGINCTDTFGLRSCLEQACVHHVGAPTVALKVVTQFTRCKPHAEVLQGRTRHSLVPRAVFSVDGSGEPACSASLKKLSASRRAYIAGQSSSAAARRAAAVRMMDHLPAPNR